MKVIVTAFALILILAQQLSAQWVQPNTSQVEKLLLDGTDLYVGTFGNGILRSTDSGENWTPINNGSVPGNVLAIAAGPREGGGTDLFIIRHPGGVFRSTDRGENWTAPSPGPQEGWGLWYLASSGTTLYLGTSGFG